MSGDDTDQRLEWPPPRPDPDREPSHPGGFRDGRDEGFWQRWVVERERVGWLIYLEEERRHGAHA